MNLEYVKANLTRLANQGPLGAKLISQQVAQDALDVIEDVCSADTPWPGLVPENGKLSIEWHTAKGDLEICIYPGGEITSWRRTDASGYEEKEFGPEIAEWVKEL